MAVSKASSSNSELQSNKTVATVGLALSALSMANLAQAEAPTVQPANNKKEATLEEVSVRAARENPYKSERLASPKYTQPLRDVPQSVTVIPKEIIRLQNAQTLEEVLYNSPGITFNSGEGAGGVGDGINIRGLSASTYGGSDIFIDGVRDSAMRTRSEMFNIEQVDVVKGSSSAEWGGGLIGGGINMVTKRPHLENDRSVSVGAGTADYKRITADINQVLDEDNGIAFRLNAVRHESGINGRDWINRDRWGIAPSLSFGLGTPTRAILAYEHLDDDGNYDYGVPTWVSGKPSRFNALGGIGNVRIPGFTAPNGGRAELAPGVKWSDYYGFRNLDRDYTRSDRINFRVEHDFSDSLQLTNNFTWNKLHREYIVTTPEGGTLTYRRLLGVASQYENEAFANQTNAIWKFNTGAISHALVSGLEFARESMDKRGGTGVGLDNRATIGDGGVIAYPTGNHLTKLPYDVDYTWGAPVETRADTVSYYLIDTIKFTPQWEMNLSYRHDKWKAHSKDTATGVSGSSTEDLDSGRIAVIYKPEEHGSIYASYATAKQPRGLASVVNSTSAASLRDAAAPIKSETAEIGTKWDVFNERLALTAAIFNTEVKNPGSDLDLTTGASSVIDGKLRVRGLELGATGAVNDKLSVFAGYTHLNSELVDQRTGNATTGEGGTLTNAPKNSASVFATYEVLPSLSISYGIRYMDKRYIAPGRSGNENSNPELNHEVPSYVVHNLTARYVMNRNIDWQLNIINLFDKHYFRQYNGRGFGIPGEGLGAQLTMNYRF
ncbi:TonB-dependent siderophore receptor [Methylobacillus sp.]|uniref:TonB-dependent receptor n=1 Tax=Methylobacillus sp. TaxID=56818 RepID=UPI0012C61D54|nr:TonB-dependent siderophore receptor [Methylobacillus sp.]MPS48159.1 TonB-dependent siderophore receptor [Methylobacillus sp.]